MTWGERSPSSIFKIKRMTLTDAPLKRGQELGSPKCPPQTRNLHPGHFLWLPLCPSCHPSLADALIHAADWKSLPSFRQVSSLRGPSAFQTGVPKDLFFKNFPIVTDGPFCKNRIKMIYLKKLNFKNTNDV